MPKVMMPAKAIDARCVSCPGLDLEVDHTTLYSGQEETNVNEIYCRNYETCRSVLQYHFETQDKHGS